MAPHSAIQSAISPSGSNLEFSVVSKGTIAQRRLDLNDPQTRSIEQLALPPFIFQCV